MEIKPCPFCGSQELMLVDRSARSVEEKPNEYNGHWIVLHNVDNPDCILSGSLCSQRTYMFKSEAIEAWNHRFDE